MLTPPPAITTEPSLTLVGSASDARSGIASVIVNGIPANSDDKFANWSVLIPALSPGDNTLQIIATDQANPANQAVSIQQIYLATSTLDFDHDGLPDDWEFNHGLNLADDGNGSNPNNGPLGDPDGDGLVNLFEFALNNNPNAHDPEAKFRTSIEVDPGDGKSLLHRHLLQADRGTQHRNHHRTSDDLQTWTLADPSAVPESCQLLSTTPNPDGITESITLRFLPAIEPPADAASFVRMRITTQGD